MCIRDRLYCPIFMSADPMLGFPPCAATISLNLSRALPDVSSSWALTSPCFIPLISSNMPATPQAFSTTLLGCCSPSSMAMASRASKAGPMALPTGCPPYVMAHSTWTVSYTHLRAHETPEHLVCRLLLEKKKKRKHKKMVRVVYEQEQKHKRRTQGTH